VYFPAVSDKRQSSDEELVLLERLKGSGETILVVEDEAAVRSFVARVLRENGYQVVEAATGQEGLEAFIAEGDRIQLVLTDVVLPDGSGLQLAHRLLSRKPQLKVLLTSGYLDEVSQLTAIREKRFPFLPKPYTVTDLLRAVREAM
jgi:two-component system cell cycle sensor histidine kinase/response regulator CckA